MVEPHLENAIAATLERRLITPRSRSTLVAISGIDGSGKGYVSERLRRELDGRGLRIALINIDGWFNLPDTRFSRESPAEHFYRHAIRFDEMFDQVVVLPLRDRRSVRVEADFAEETASRYRRHLYEFTDIDVFIVEGIYLLKRQFQSHYDLSFWIDCGFETALERAVARAQEGLSPDLTLAAYRTIYFPAQAIHLARDEPRATATAVINNDPRLVTTSSLRA